MPRKRPPHLHREINRHDNVVWYVRRAHGARIRIRAEYDSKEFWAEYRAAIEGVSIPASKPRMAPYTLGWAIDKYRNSSAWAALKPATRRQRENIYRAVLAAAGEAPLSEVDEDMILDGRERRASVPHAANNFLKAMRGFFKWAAGDGKLVSVDPTLGVRLLKGPNDDAGHHTWTEDELARFEARWPLGTRERLAYDLILYTGLRRGDVVRLGRQHVRDGVATIRMEKTGDEVVFPILPPLAKSLAAGAAGDLTFLVTERGAPFVKEGFGNWFRDACRAAGVPGSAHGLRKAGARRAAEHGASDRELMAFFGWNTAKMATHYTRAAERKLLAAQAAQKLLPAHMQNVKRPHRKPSAGANPKSSTKKGA